jgi:hypothetical protein
MRALFPRDGTNILTNNKRVSSMTTEEKIFNIAFEADGIQYTGWVNPSDKFNKDGFPASFHVVLNDVSFGYVTHNNGEWTTDEDRPEGLIEKVGKAIERNYAV